MEWIDCHHLAGINTVDDFDDLLKVINDPNLTEFQYLVDGGNWSVSMEASFIIVHPSARNPESECDVQYWC